MSVITQQLRASYAFVERDINIIRRYWAWEAVWMAYSIANSLSVSYIGLGMGEITGAANVNSRFLVLYLVVGTLVWRYLSIIFYWVSDVIGIERWEGTIEYTLMAPMRRITHIAGQTLFAVVYAIATTAFILLVTVLMFDLDLSRANLLGGLIMLAAGSFSFIGVGVMASVLPLLFPERGSQMTHVIIAVLLLVSGVYYPVNVLPSYLQALSTFSPATYVIEGTRQALLNGVPTLQLWTYIWPLIIMGAIAVPAGLWVFEQAENYAKRAGKLHRNG
jgi:ABC-2 type transport system permease protein